MEEIFHRTVKSFVLRSGRITKLQQHALDNYAKLYSIPYETGQRLDFAEVFHNINPTLIEIGFGDGEATYQMAEGNPGMNYLALEVYPPGVGALLDVIHTKSCQCTYSSARCRRGGGEHGGRQFCVGVSYIFPGSLAEKTA